MSAELQRFQREIVEVCEFYVDNNNEAKTNIIYLKNLDGTFTFNNPTKYLQDYFSAQGQTLKADYFEEEVQNNNENNDNLENINEIDTL